MTQDHTRWNVNTRWSVFKEYYGEGAEWMIDQWPFLYSSEQEAVEWKTKLEAGSDPSFFSPDVDGYLYVDRFDL